MAISKQVMTKNVANVAHFNTDENTFRVLQETLYPGSTDQEVLMILSYCRARKIDPILKPVHLVPMNVKTGKKDKEGKDEYARKNVIMPGIGLYRIDASRSGQYAGVSEPEFGEDVTEEIGKVTVTYPKWCKITVKKLLADGTIAEFTAREFWKENYACKSKWDNSPNEIWSKRAYGQLAKCAEAQALRKAFPDVVGNEYTKEEMEGKIYFHEEIKQEPEKLIKVEEKIETRDIDQDCMDIAWAENTEQLQEIFTKLYKHWVITKDKEALARLMSAKDKRKLELSETAEVIDDETGELV